MTYSRYVLDQRLALAYRSLRSPRFAARTVSSIAHEAGSATCPTSTGHSAAGTAARRPVPARVHGADHRPGENCCTRPVPAL
jgi:hypothetical protein